MLSVRIVSGQRLLLLQQRKNQAKELAGTGRQRIAPMSKSVTMQRWITIGLARSRRVFESLNWWEVPFYMRWCGFRIH